MDESGDASMLRDAADPDTPRPASKSFAESKNSTVKIDVNKDTLTPPTSKVDTPRPKSEPPVFDSASRQRSTESASPRLTSISNEEEEEEEENKNSDIPQPQFLVETPSKFDKMTAFDLTSKHKGEAEDISIVEKYVEPSESALFFAFMMSAHVYLGCYCTARWWFWEENGFIVIPLFLLSIGATLDNYRLYRGIVLGKNGLETWLTTTAYLLEFSALPLLFITLSEIFSIQTGLWFVPIPVRVLSVTMCVANFNAFMAGVQGEYETVHQGGVWRHTIDPFKVPFQIMITPVWCAVIGLFLGFLSLCIYSDSASFLIQVVAFFGQALATREPRSGQYVTNLLEFVYMGSLLYMYKIHV